MKTLTPLALADLRESAASGDARRVREEARLTQAEVAAHCGVTEACISRWEDGSRRPRHGEAARRYRRLLVALEKQISSRGSP